ncbi:MAG: type 4a pilus biogenesis protein PilO [Candidatus Methylomirabilales bacterium]
MKHRLLYLAIGFLLLNLAFFMLTILPARRTVRAHAATVHALQTRMRTLRREQREQRLMAALLKGMEQFRSRIPPQGAIVAMIRRVTDQARRLHLYVPSVKYHPGEVPEEALVTLTVQMEVEGRYAAIRRFLYEIEGLQDPLMIEKLALTSQRGGDRLTLRLQMAAYFLAEKESRNVDKAATAHPVEEARTRVAG